MKLYELAFKNIIYPGEANLTVLIKARNIKEALILGTSIGNKNKKSGKIECISIELFGKLDN